MILQLNRHPHNITWGYRTIALYFKIARDEQIVKYWSQPEWMEWKRNLIYIARNLPPKQGVAPAA